MWSLYPYRVEGDKLIASAYKKRDKDELRETSGYAGTGVAGSRCLMAGETARQLVVTLNGFQPDDVHWYLRL